MHKTDNTTTADAPVALVHRLGTRAAFSRVKVFVALYGAFSVLVLLANGAIATTGHGDAVSTFMWTRSSIIVASAVLIYWLAVRASRGLHSAYWRVRILSIILPVAIVAVDMIPGVSPLWFTLAQAVCALALAPVAFIVSGRRLRAVFAAR
jgi:hypothetical protein